MDELFPYQKIGVAYLKSNKRALLFDEPGLGKTVQNLRALSETARTIVICPASVKGVWEKEILRWTSFKPTILNGEGSFRFPVANEIVILNPDIMSDLPIGIRFPYNLILDEVHAFKSLKAIRTKKLKQLRYFILSNGGCVWGSTGTPILSKPDDLWGILSAIGLERDAFGAYDNFLRVFNGKKLHFKTFSKISWGTPLPEVVNVIKKVALGRRRTDVLPELPTKTYETYEVPVPGYGDILGDVNIDEVMSSPGILSTVRAKITLEKAKAATPYLTILAETEPLVVFSSHVDASDYLAEHFGTKAITGELDIDKRQRLVDDFQAGKTNVIVGTIGAMGVGLTLTKSNRVIFISRDWTPALNSQAEDRVCRIGQSKPVLVTDILCYDLTEKLIYKVLMKKQGIINNSIEVSR